MTDDGPILEIWMQSFSVDCSECGESVQPTEATTEQFGYPDGSFAHRPICLACARRLGIKDEDTTYL